MIMEYKVYRNNIIMEQQLISFKFDFSLVHTKLTQTIRDLQSKISSLSQKTNQIENQLHTQTNSLNDRVSVVEEKIQFLDANTNDRIAQILSKKPQQQNQQPFNFSLEKTPTQVLDDMEKRVNSPTLNTDDKKELQINYNPSNSQRVCYTVKIKEEEEDKNIQNDFEARSSREIDRKCLDIYGKITQVVERQITKARADFREQIFQWKNQSGTLMNEIDKNKIKHEERDRNKQKNHNQKGHRVQKEKGENKEGKSEKRILSLSKSKERKEEREIDNPKGTTQKSIRESYRNDKNEQNHENYENNERYRDEKSSRTIEKEDHEYTPKKNNHSQDFAKLKKQFEVNENNTEEAIKELKQKIADLSKSNSIAVDHIVQCKKNIQQVTNKSDSLRLQVNGLNEKSFSSERQLSILVQSSNQQKNKFKELETNYYKFVEQYNEQKKLMNEDMMKEDDGDDDKKNDPFKDSRSSFRSSATAGLGPLRPSNIIKQNNNRIETLQEAIKKQSVKLATFIERVNKMEDEKKKFGEFQSNLLPKIDKENKSNVNHFEIIKKDIKRINEDLTKTNDKLTRTKEKLSQLYDAHAQIPTKIDDIYIKLRQYNEIQEDRLIDLIKELINRMLTDPFDNNFTNTLKREINVKFLQIKHEYNSILKEIGNKLDGRAEQTEVQKIKEQFQENIIEAKTLINKKCQIQDFKKGIKYLEGKVKDVFQYAKSETVALHNQQKKYIGGRKQG